MKKSPGDFLKHYEQATECLYEENAPYPKKIAYAYSTPHLAVEALEARSGVVSLENSCSDSFSQESTYISSDPVSQSNDVSYDVSADSNSQPMELDLTNQNDKGESSQTNTNSVNKLNQIELLKKYDKASDSSLSIDSSDIYEDDEGNIIVTAKLENIGRSSSSDGENSQSKSKVADIGIPTVLSRQSFGFEPMITDEAEVTKKTDGVKMDVDVQSNIEENSQDIKDSVATALENVVSTVETVDSILSDVTVKSEISTVKSEVHSPERNLDNMDNIPAKNEDNTLSSEEVQKSNMEGMHKAVASKKDSVALSTSLVSQYDSTSSEDEGQTSKRVQKINKNDDSENGEPEQGKKTSAAKQGEVRTLGTLFDDVSHDHSVNVLEISEGGISGDVTEQTIKSGKETNPETPGQPVEKKSSDIGKVVQGESLGSVEGQKEVVNCEVGMEVDETSVKKEPDNSQNTITESSKNEENKMETNLEVKVDSLMKEDSEKKKDTSNNKDKEENTEKMECEDTIFDKSDDNKETAAKGKSSSEMVKETDVKDREKEMLEKKMEEITEKETEVKLSGKTGEQLHKLLIEKCMAALHLCLSRFPTHYKSMYRLADVYVNSPYHKNLKFAQDLLLGSSNWQQQSHMPAQGLFGDKKQNNFFQGIWRIPIGDIDRSGSFASHMNRSVMLLLEVLKQRRELTLMYQIHLWMNRSPESGKKYLRDSERILFVKMSFRLRWGNH
ncbi:CABIN1 [Mytilus edulis]|uniref:CABIN1 n=1 Tax=Mytilus edulis TaxID=6550 RepID=A0A8S3SIB3_MYTED|nr:CABIN1 [Mytilus edulis]